MIAESQSVLIIGSRGSDLARWQAEHVASRLQGEVRIEIIKTKGDQMLDVPLQGRVDKGFFTKEIEDALLDGRVDLAVHSLKDLPTTLPPGLFLGAVSERAQVSDVLLVRPEKVDTTRLIPVVDGGRIGATSLRRQALLRRFAPELEAVMLRGNVPTRLRKLRENQYDAIIVARAGLDRLELDQSGLHAFELNPDIWIPAPGQAALGIEVRSGDKAVLEALQGVNHPLTSREVRIERSLLARFEGGCHVAFGAWARIRDGKVLVLAGHEDEQGRWLAVQIEATQDKEAEQLAYDTLMQVMKTKVEVDSWDGVLATRWRPSY